MTPLSQLPEAGIDDRFHIAGIRPVGFLLAGYARDGVQFSVQLGGTRDMFLTTLLSVLPERDLMVFDCSGSTEVNRRLPASERNIFVGRPGGIHVQFAIGRVGDTIHAGSRAFAAALPAVVVRLQRRECFRVDTPHSHPLQFFGRLEGALLKLPAHDISANGLALTAGELPAGLEVGKRLENCHLALPEDEHQLFFEAIVRHMTPIDGRTGARFWRIGLQFDHLPAGAENRIQRYIVRIERERHELIS